MNKCLFVSKFLAKSMRLVSTGSFLRFSVTCSPTRFVLSARIATVPAYLLCHKLRQIRHQLMQARILCHAGQSPLPDFVIGAQDAIHNVGVVQLQLSAERVLADRLDGLRCG